MKLISGLTDQAKQTANILVAGGQKAYLSFEYSGVSQSWFYSVVYGNVQVSGLRLVATLDLLRPWTAILGWTLVVTTTNGLDPNTVSALADGSTSIYLLDNEAATQAVTPY